MYKTSVRLLKIHTKIPHQKRNFLVHRVQNVPENLAKWLHFKTDHALRREKNKVEFLEGRFLDGKLSFLHKKKTDHCHGFWTFSFQFLSFNGVFLTLKCRTLVLKLGFAKRRPAAQRPAAHGPRRPRGPAAQQPGGPVLIFQFFCPAVNPRAYNGRRWVWIRLPFNHLNPCFCLLHVVQIKTFSFSVHSSLYRNR